MLFSHSKSIHRLGTLFVIRVRNYHHISKLNPGNCLVKIPKYSQTRNYTKAESYRAGPNFIKLGFQLVALIPLSYAFYLGYGINQENTILYEQNLQQFKDQTPVELPPRTESLLEMEYKPVILRGRFENENEVLIGPRTNLHFDRSNYYVMSYDVAGYYLMTPFVVEDGRRFLVNRGWISKSRKNSPVKRSVGQIEGPTTLVGHVAFAEKMDFVSEMRSNLYMNRWIYSNNFTKIVLDELARKLDIEPVAYFVADQDSAVKNGPVPGQLVVEGPKWNYSSTIKYVLLYFVLQLVVTRIR